MKVLIMKDVNLVGFLGHILVSAVAIFYTFIMTLLVSFSTKLVSLLIFVGVSFFCHYLIISMINKTSQNGDMTLNSLPLEKEKIVLGRYLSFSMYSLILPVSIYILSFFIKWNMFLVGDKVLDISVIIVAISFLTIFNSIYLFAYYNKESSSKKIELISIILLGMIIFFVFRYWDYILDSKILQYLESFNIILLLLLIFSIIIYIASFNISKKMYKKKEF